MDFELRSAERGREIYILEKLSISIALGRERRMGCSKEGGSWAFDGPCSALFRGTAGIVYFPAVQLQSTLLLSLLSSWSRLAPAIEAFNNSRTTSAIIAAFILLTAQPRMRMAPRAQGFLDFSLLPVGSWCGLIITRETQAGPPGNVVLNVSVPSNPMFPF